jgi:hypothetical protein
MISLAGVAFEVVPECALSPAEQSVLRGLGAADPREPSERSFRLHVSGDAPWAGCELDEFPDHGPAQMSVAGNRLRVAHRRFAAEIRPDEWTGRLARREPTGGALQAALRVALSCCLPQRGGLPLHAAGVRIDGGAVAFFGPSGAGKSTLAASSPFPVVSDELVAVTGSPFTLQSTGFWGAFPADAGAARPAPLLALVELAKGPTFGWERLDAAAALRRLVNVALVPAVPVLWRDVIGVLGRLARTVPCYRMAWSPDERPWENVQRSIGADAEGPNAISGS